MKIVILSAADLEPPPTNVTNTVWRVFSRLNELQLMPHPELWTLASTATVPSSNETVNRPVSAPSIVVMKTAVPVNSKVNVDPAVLVVLLLSEHAVVPVQLPFP